MKRFLVSIASTAGLLLAGAPAWADPTPTSVQWTYNFTPNQPFVQSNSGTGSITFTNEPVKTASNSSDVVLTNLKVSSTATDSSPDSFHNAAWSGGLVITDTTSGASATLNFSGLLNGVFSAGNANVANTFTGQNSYTVKLGATTYTVTVGNFTPPGPPSATNVGSISVHVDVTGTGHTGGEGGAPEPSTLLLSCLGLSLVGAAARRKRRAQAAAVESVS